MLAESDRGLFPFYWYKPSKIAIFITTRNDLAISINNIVKGKKDRITVRKTMNRIEETHFPNLDYTSWSMFHVPEKRHGIVMRGGTFDVGQHPFITLSSGVDVRILQARIEARVRGYPRERLFLWFLTSPNLMYLSKDKAESGAELDFWGYLSYLVTNELDFLLARGVGQETLRLFLSSIGRVKEEYRQLISRQDLIEQMLQNFLEKHYFLLSPKRRVKLKKRKLGPYIPDFILQYGDDTKILVEIQLNRDPIIENNQPSSGMREAVTQLRDWFKWIDANEHSTLSEYCGLIVIGRKESCRKNEVEIKNILSQIGYPTSLLTYDDLEDSIDYVLSQLKEARNGREQTPLSAR